MSLDDFIDSESVGAPVGVSLTPSLEATRMADDSRAFRTTASAIPIKTRKGPAPHPIPQSVPVAVHHQRLPDEFGYVPRHTRKTSIDETSKRVSWRASLPWPCTSVFLPCSLPVLGIVSTCRSD